MKTGGLKLSDLKNTLNGSTTSDNILNGNGRIEFDIDYVQQGVFNNRPVNVMPNSSSSIPHLSRKNVDYDDLKNVDVQRASFNLLLKDPKNEDIVT